MVLFGAITARGRAKKVPGRLLAAADRARAGRRARTLGLVVALGIFEPTPRYLVPVGGMVIGNAMTASAVALNRLGDEMADSRGQDRGDPGARRDRRARRRRRSSAAPCARG